MMVDEIVNKIIASVHLLFTEEQINSLRDNLFLVLYDYDISKKCTEIALTDNSDEKKISMFFVAKSIEGMAESSIKYYMTVINNFRKIITVPLKDITTDHVRYFLATKAKKDGISKVSLCNIRRILLSFFNWMVAEGYIDRNPVLRIKNIKTEVRIKDPFTEEEMEIIRNHCESSKERAIIEFLYSTGVRVSELCSLDRDDIDFYSDSVKVLGKGSKERYVYLNAKSKFALKNYFDERKDTEKALFVSDRKPFYRMKKSSIEFMLRSIGNRCKIDKVHPHRFRRTAATIALNRGMPIEQVQQMLGHSKIETTTIYAKSDRQNVKMSHRKYLS